MDGREMELSCSPIFRSHFVIRHSSFVISSLIRHDVVWLRKHDDWNAPVLLIGGLFLMGAVPWLFVNPSKKVFE